MANLPLFAGVDEAGRGPLAGPVLAAAVILNPEQPINGLKDSKLLSEQRRQELSTQIKTHALNYCIAQASAAEIDELNILQATLLAMQRAVEGLAIRPDEVLVDGNRLPLLAIPAQAIVQGDNLIEVISAASILAKVARDEIMIAYHQKYPEFSFHRHKGYGTKLHLAELAQFGRLDIHRQTFKPVKSFPPKK